MRQAKGKRMRKKSDNIFAAEQARRNSADLRADWSQLLKMRQELGLASDVVEGEPAAITEDQARIAKSVVTAVGSETAKTAPPPFPSNETMRQAKGKRMRKKSDNIFAAERARRNSADLRADWAQLLKMGQELGLASDVVEGEP